MVVARYLSAASRVAKSSCMWSGALPAVAIFPVGILADAINHHLAPDAIASRDLADEAGEWNERVHEIDVGLAPNPGMHAAHGSAEDSGEDG